ncbi:tyrosine-type recombinase/integrase [Haloimpatiens massiliensis]|uniref:tyrosine-type recombinase/integrase n=1 Tax=Haloimpatiens massiliensis TaxID=1658110 RepID=UPI000C861ECC|nr:tyrosine-type recombinase/integrase [Haloimpatiens massiliensis]
MNSNLKNSTLNIDEERVKEIAYDGDVKVINNSNIGKLPFFDCEIYFSDDTWDFGLYFENNGQTKNIYKFSKINEEYRDYVKEYILELIINKYKSTSINKYFYMIKRIVNFLIENKIYSCVAINKVVIDSFENFINESYKSELSRSHLRMIFRRLLSLIELDNNVDYSMYKKILNKNNIELIKAQNETGKTPQIPNDIFDNIIRCALKEIKNNNITNKNKMEACIVLLLTQVGMRIKELQFLEANKRKEISCFDGKTKISYLGFLTFKTTRRERGGVVTKSFLTELADLAYVTLEELTEEKRKLCNNNHIFIGKTADVINQSTIRRYERNFIVRNAKEIGVFNKKCDGSYIMTKNSKKDWINYRKYLKNINDEDFIAIPNSHQFRVTVCNKLINEGVQIGWVMEHMNHLSPEMTKHYIRKEKVENKELSRKFFKGVLKKEFKAIGDQAEQLMEKINEYIEKGHFNIKVDIDDIADYLAGQIPIRERALGFCIKSAFGKKCKYNEVMCAFDMCPNHITCFINADISYKRFKNQVKSIKYNEENNFKQEAKIEKGKLRRLIDRNLKYELEELKVEIDNQGETEIIRKYPQLKEITEEIDKIMMEVKDWKRKI